MATFKKTLSGDDRYYIELEVKEVTGSVSIKDNTSDVSYKLTATKKSGTGFYSNSSVNTVKVTIDGQDIVNKKMSYDFTGSTPKTITLASGTLNNIEHNADGTKTLSCKGYFKDGANSLGSGTASGSLTLSTIPRASSISLSGDIILGSPITIQISRASNDFLHELTYSFGNIQDTYIASGIGTSYQWTPPLNLAQQIPNADRGVMTITCYTYKASDSSSIGSKILQQYAYVPNNLYPSVSISNPTISGDTPASWGIFVKGKSTATYTLTGTGNQGSTITSYESSLDGYTYTNANVTTNTLMTAGTNTINAKVIDSRGKQASATKTFQVLDYSNPTISVAQVQRCDENGNIDKNGNYCLISYEASITSLSGNNTNYATYLIKYKIHDSSDDYQAIPLSAFRNSYSATGMLYTDGIYPANRGSGTKLQLPSTNTYDIQFVVGDYFTEATNVQTLDTGFDLLNFNASGKSMAIGKVSEASANEELLEVALKTEFLEDVEGGTINFTSSNYHDATKQDILVSGTNIKTINNTSILGSGNIDIQGGGTSTNVKINGTSITSDGVADIKTNGSYNATSNKIATMSDIPTIPFVPTRTSDLINDSNFPSDASYVHTDNNYTTTEKNKLSGIASGAEVNVQANWTETNTSSDAYIKNKPSLSSVATQTNAGTSDRPIYLNNGTATQTNTPASGNYFRGIPFVTSGGVMEIGRYIDFHPTNDSTLDFSKRLDAGSGTTARTLTLPDKTGTIAITSDIPTKTGDLTNNGDGTSGYKYINDIGKDGLYYGDSELKGIGVYEDDQIYFEVINGNITYTKALANISDLPTKVSELTNDSGYTTNTGTITGIKMNGASKGTSGVVDLGTVITSHQTIKTINNTSMTGSGNVSVQPTLVSGTNIKTINNVSLLGSGNITIGGGGTATDVQVNGTSITSGGVANLVTQSAYNSSTNKIATYNDVTGYHDSTKQATLVSGTNIKTINSTSLLGSGNVAVQPTLVSGTNIKTINSTSLLGSGNIAVQSTLSTTTGTLSITKTSGNSTCTGTYARYGNVVSLDLELKTTGTINSGADVFVGKITTFTPKKTGELMGYYGARPIIAGYGTDQVITVRNAGTSNIGSGNTLDIRGIVIV